MLPKSYATRRSLGASSDALLDPVLGGITCILIDVNRVGIMGPLRWAECVDGLVGPLGCHLSENIMRKVAF